MPQYAAQTQVPVDRSRAEIERTLARYGATSFAYFTRGDLAAVMFEAHGRRIKFELPLPSRDDPRFTVTPTRQRRSTAAATAAWEQACRQRWRALNLAVKAKLEAVEAGIATFEDEFLAYIALPNGTTVGEWASRQIAHAYETNSMPALMPGVATAS